MKLRSTYFFKTNLIIFLKYKIKNQIAINVGVLKNSIFSFSYKGIQHILLYLLKFMKCDLNLK